MSHYKNVDFLSHNSFMYFFMIRKSNNNNKYSVILIIWMINTSVLKLQIKMIIIQKL